MRTCTNPECRAEFEDGRRICPKCAAPAPLPVRENSQMSLERRICTDLEQQLPPGGNLPRSQKSGEKPSSSAGGKGPLTRPELLATLFVSAIMILIGCIQL